MITVIYENCGDINSKQFESEDELALWLENTTYKAIVIRGDQHELEDHT